ncbi:aminotransferase class III-fold pyridoxal phosphate-dependent enzyme [Nocardioides lijunqiniae]|uniref:aminotransferase class III-fold pyridoxal phosphate-dependent enzyme n=1 Tax=Nocardioides lijunqiniae TaxID=2760832 RepID=UPI0018789B7F|nr:aminotransferase class III-fold pyridoxal phosphate-dependent enzyme [Nocardioides lijunqiniae]
MTTTQSTTSTDQALRARARGVIPGGMYGHMSMGPMPPSYPQFMARGEGARLWDVDGREYVDLMCGWGTIVLGRQHQEVDAAVAAQLGNGDCLNGPGPVMVDLAELLVETIPSADWSMFAKNGTDATTMSVTIARAATGRRRVLMANGAYHGAAPWCTPGPSGVLPEDRAFIDKFDYNDVESLRAAVAAAGDDLAAIIVSPVRQDNRRDQELALPEFAREVRELATSSGAVLILDDVRCGFRLDVRGSWEPLGIRPDLTAWSKAIANGHPLAAVTGIDSLAEAASSIYTTGSFWFAPTAMAAAITTVTLLRDTDAMAHTHRMAQLMRDGIEEQARRHGLEIRQSGPAAMPLVLFEGDTDLSTVASWADECVSRGVYLHPWHNWFYTAAHQPEDIAWALERTDDAFAAVAARRTA